MQGLSNLEVGKCYSYKQLCAFFNEERKDGNSKKAQLKEWKRFFIWENPTPQKYLIKEIRSEPLPEEDGRHDNGGNNTSPYISLDDIIMASLDENEETTCTINQLAVNVGILSKKYTDLRKNSSEFCNVNDYSEEMAYAYLGYLKDCVCKAIESSLTRLSMAGYLITRKYISLLLFDGQKIDLDERKSSELTEYETAILKKMCKHRWDLRVPSVAKDFSAKMQALIFELWGYEIKYYYREYYIKKVSSNYKPKGMDDIQQLTRKFVFTITYNMLKYILSKKQYIEDTQTGEIHEVFICEEDVDTQRLFRDVVSLTNSIFVYMNADSWGKYWDDAFLSKKGEEKESAYLFTYCLNNNHIGDNNNPITTARKGDIVPNTNTAVDFEDKDNIDVTPYLVLSQAECREAAISLLGVDEVCDCEHILPNIDWKKIHIDIDYMYRCLDAINMYHDLRNLLIYCKEEYVDSYCLYRANLVYTQSIDTPLSLNEYDDKLRNV